MCVTVLSVLLSTFFSLSGFGNNDFFHSDVLQCEKQGAIVDARVCVRVFCRRDRARLFPTASHMLGHTAALCPQLHGTQGKKKGKNKY